ncbi:hypothetical protein [Rickettsia endosymbiont of Halotydeus destructor]|uniref:hypothetical protein n=1 Tax=Rickettsia endosymbiont of Halotydeus destructor TaxID=2996754 RepID=UPI003BAFE3C3
MINKDENLFAIKNAEEPQIGFKNIHRPGKKNFFFSLPFLASLLLFFYFLLNYLEK